MAEGWCRRLKGDIVDASSAGVEASGGVDILAVRAMAEAGIDISRQHSKSVAELAGKDFDYVITMCGHANETCPVFKGKAMVIHAGFDDPPKLARNSAGPEEAMAHYRRVRDEIGKFVLSIESYIAGSR